mgnify:FL=1
MTRRFSAAFAFGTVLPIARPDDRFDGRAMAALPVVGAALGLIAAGASWIGLHMFGPHNPLTGVLMVTVLLLATRGMHVDGLADTADGLGCYGPPERALQVMRGGSVGAFGVAAVAVAILAQVLAFSQFPSDTTGLAAIVTAVTTGRVAAVAACRRGVPAAPGSVLGGGVAGTQAVPTIMVWVFAVAGMSIPAAAHPWQGPVVVLASLAVSVALAAHCTRRFGGVNGDLLGAIIEVTTTLTAIGLVIGLLA